MTEQAEQKAPANILDEMREERKKIAEDMALLKKERAEFEEMKAQEILGGKTDAGQAPVLKKEITAKEYAQAAMRGKVLE